MHVDITCRLHAHETHILKTYASAHMHVIEINSRLYTFKQTSIVFTTNQAPEIAIATANDVNGTTGWHVTRRLLRVQRRAHNHKSHV